MDKPTQVIIIPKHAEKTRFWWKTHRYIQIQDGGYSVFCGLFMLPPSPNYEPTIFLTFSHKGQKITIPFHEIHRLLHFLNELDDFLVKRFGEICNNFGSLKKAHQEMRKVALRNEIDHLEVEVCDE